MLIEAENKRRDYEQKLGITRAWYAAYLQRVKNFPRLQKILDDIKPREKPRATTPEEMLDWARNFATMYGKVVEKDAGSTMQDA